MFSRVIPFSGLTAQGRWKVEFFVSDRKTARSTAYPLCPLREVLSERREFLDPQQYPDRLFNFLGLEHILSRTGDLVDGYEPRSGRDVLSRCKVFRRGDVLYGRLRPSLNKVYVADGPVSEGICSGEFYVLVPDAGRILPHLVRSVLASRYVQDVVRSMTSGSALPRLALDDLLKTEVPLPPLEVQRAYEQALVAQAVRREQLRAELREGPAADLEALVAALEDGTELKFPRVFQPRHSGLGGLALPDGGGVAARGRGRPAGKSHRLLF